MLGVVVMQLFRYTLSKYTGDSEVYELCKDICSAGA